MLEGGTQSSFQSVRKQWINSSFLSANQETLVEVLGFLKRTFPNQETANSTNKGAVKSVRQDSMPNRASKVSVGPALQFC